MPGVVWASSSCSFSTLAWPDKTKVVKWAIKQTAMMPGLLTWSFLLSRVVNFGFALCKLSDRFQVHSCCDQYRPKVINYGTSCRATAPKATTQKQNDSVPIATGCFAMDLATGSLTHYVLSTHTHRLICFFLPWPIPKSKTNVHWIILVNPDGGGSLVFFLQLRFLVPVPTQTSRIENSRNQTIWLIKRMSQNPPNRSLSENTIEIWLSHDLICIEIN